MLFGVLRHYDSLRELEIGMKAEINKLSHLGIDYVVRRSTLAEANQGRPQEFFASVYASLLEQYAPFLAGSRNKGGSKGLGKSALYDDSTIFCLRRANLNMKQEEWNYGAIILRSQ